MLAVEVAVHTTLGQHHSGSAHNTGATPHSAEVVKHLTALDLHPCTALCAASLKAAFHK